jgi:hypothetical protein
MMDRGAATSGNRDKNNGVVDYTSGPVRFGKGGTHMAVLDISCGTLPPFWYLALKNAVSGAHLVATILVLGGDTNNIPDRGRTFAMFYQATAIQSVAEDWAETVNWLPASEGRGINGYGCNIVLGIDNSVAAASAHLKENWIELQDSSLNSKGNSWYAARFICNYPLSNANEKTWELP